jgi:ELWxxDGT repeat protein
MKTIVLSIFLSCLTTMTPGQVPTMVQDINVGINPSSVSPSGLYPWGGYLYFFADDSVHGSELWRYDELSPPTMVQDYFPGVTSIGGGPVM